MGAESGAVVSAGGRGVETPAEGQEGRRDAVMIHSHSLTLSFSVRLSHLPHYPSLPHLALSHACLTPGLSLLLRFYPHLSIFVFLFLS